MRRREGSGVSAARRAGPASPTTSGRLGAVGGHHRHAAGERLGGGEAEPLVERGIDEDAGGLEEPHQAGAVDAAQSRHPERAPALRSAAPAARSPSRRGRRGRAAADCGSSRRSASQASSSGADVLARLERAGVEDVARGRAQLPAGGRDLLRLAGPELGVDPGIDHADLLRALGEMEGEVARRGLARSPPAAAPARTRGAGTAAGSTRTLSVWVSGKRSAVRSWTVATAGTGQRSGRVISGDQKRSTSPARQPRGQAELLPEDAERRLLVLDRRCPLPRAPRPPAASDGGPSRDSSCPPRAASSSSSERV